MSCAVDSVPSGGYSGTVPIPSYSVDLVPLCDGWVALADDDNNQIAFINPLSGQAGDGLQLDAAPGRLTLDRERNIIFAALDPTKEIAKVDLINRQVKGIEGASVTRLAIGNGGQVLGITPIYPSAGLAQMQVFDTKADKLLATLNLPDTDGLESQIVYDRARNFIVISGIDRSRYVFDPQNLTVTSAEIAHVGGEEAEDLAMSLDGKHVAEIYRVTETPTTNFTVVEGVWQTGAYPVAGVFSDDGMFFVASDDDRLLLFDATTYNLIKSVAPAADSSRCNGTSSLGGPRRVGFSRGGKLAFMLNPSCVFQRTGGFIVYTTVQ